MTARRAERRVVARVVISAAVPPDSPATPYLLIDTDIVERNLVRMTAYVASHDLKLRPHAKTHKSLRIARKQLRHGAIGITTSKVGEAEALRPACDDLLIAYPIVDRDRAARVVALAQDATVRAAVDSQMSVEMFAAALREEIEVGLLVDLDVGYHRTGVQTARDACKLAQYIDLLPGARFDGLFCYPGHVR